MNRNVEFTKLMRMARDHMEDNGFSPTSVSSYMRTWRSVYNFGLSKGITKYSAELAEQNMLEKYHACVHELVQCRIFFQSNPSSLWCRILTLFWRVGKWENKL